VEIPYERGLLGHSDADVLIHALCDALLGAAGLGDIGQHFPDTDPRYAGVDSRLLLSEVNGMLQARGFQVGNVDCTVIAQNPKLRSHIPAMAANLAAALGVDAARVNIKAKTNEGIGHLGRGEGIAAHVVVLIDHER
jgi:2-C-methyl-D-erythritol 2,4-cyclodiphosphate synthase